MRPSRLSLLLLPLGILVSARPSAEEAPEARTAPAPSSCVECHEGIEDMHPAAFLSCVDCHGGDATARRKTEAHVSSTRPERTDERVLPLDEDLAWRRFKNPMDLRVVDRTCGECHADLVRHLATSLHGTTAGHLSDGFYEVGLLEEKRSAYSVFNVPKSRSDGPLESLTQIPPFLDRLPEDELATHYTDLPRKECMQCHLWSEGRAVRGRVGFDGDYRGEGCAACHVAYAVDGLSRSADVRAVRTEPGHPRVHALDPAPATDTCVTCHYGDASIGLAFRGLSQLPPGAPGGPEVSGTTDRLLNRQFYLDDPRTCPPDVHHERGMHCIDCHTRQGVMGDGRTVGAMEEQVAISCQACHGTFDAPSELRTESGIELDHLRREGDAVVLTSKVTGAEHVVPQVVHVLDPQRPEYDADAARAMTSAHADVECYTCHAGWNVNFLGFHFDRNETLSQLDLISGRRTPGRVTTQEKVFATWKSFYAGLNEAGRVAPYMTGFSTMGSVTDEDGVRILDQVFPVTAAGLSGLTMIHHQTHTVRPTARSCVECHRSSATWGLGSTNFRLARQLAFVGDRRGIEVVALDRTQLAASIPLTKIVQPDVVALALRCDPLQGHAEVLFAAEGERGIHVFDVREPTGPRRLAFVATLQPQGLALEGDVLYVADGVGGLKLFDVSNPAEPDLRGRVSTFEANAVSVQWPWAYVADGPGGIAICDVRVPSSPAFVSALAIGENENVPDAITGVDTLFQYSRPTTDEDGRPADERTPARHLAAVMDIDRGLSLVDVTEPTRPFLLYPTGRRRTSARGEPVHTGLVLRSHVDLAEPQGGVSTRERDYAYITIERGPANNRATQLLTIDVTDPASPEIAGAVRAAAGSESATLLELYNPPFLQSVVLVPGTQGVLASDVSSSKNPTQIGALGALRESYCVAVEEFPLDRTVDERGRPLKDVSHAGSRWLRREEFARILDVPAAILGSVPEGLGPLNVPGATARLHFDRLDADGDGLLLDAEFAAGGGAAIDLDGDARITLLELAQATGTLRLRNTRPEAPAAPSVFSVERIGENGDLARLLDGVDPRAFDRDDDYRLSRKELEAAVFAALDLDGDGGLTRDELSRHPGELRQLRYGGEWARSRFASFDSNRDGRLSLREFDLHDAELEALDRDGNGEVQLESPPEVQRRSRPEDRLPSEWPLRRRWDWPVPPTLTLEQVRATFDRDRDGRLTRRELSRRPDLIGILDFDGDQIATEAEQQDVVNVVAQFGLDAIADGFLARWDLDGDGRVTSEELPPWPGSARILGR